MRVLLGLFVLLAAVAPRVSWANTYAEEMAFCENYAATDPFITGNSLPPRDCKVAYTPEGQGYIQLWANNLQGVYLQWTGWQFDGPVPPDASCTGGAAVAPGTAYKFSSSTGEACTAVGSSMCEMSLVVGGPLSGSQMLTGAACSSSDLADKGPVPPKGSETTNADGSKTYCDPISGKCVTSSAGPSQAPASSSSSANSSTDTASTTDHPATSSSSTTTSTSTTTTTGDGSGSGTGSGNSTGVTTGTSTAKTDTPASSSSTASKCTTGACDVGNADGNIGQLYQAGTDTPGSVYGQFKAAVSTSPIITAATGFFDASSLSGSTCPTWQIPGNKYWGQSGFSFDFFCSSGMLALLALAGYMVLAVGAFSAFRIAIY